MHKLQRCGSVGSQAHAHTHTHTHFIMGLRYSVSLATGTKNLSLLTRQSWDFSQVNLSFSRRHYKGPFGLLCAHLVDQEGEIKKDRLSFESTACVGSFVAKWAQLPIITLITQL